MKAMKRDEKENTKGGGQEFSDKQSSVDKAANIAKDDNYMSERDDTRNRNRRDHSEKVSGKGSAS